jgi:formylglycine-generating enzyme required for sulfatase activity
MRARRLTALAAVVLAACGGARPPDAREGMVRIPAGTFTRGADLGERATLGWEKAAQPAHPVTLRAFLIDVHEVTNAEFERFDPKHRRSEASACDDCPVTDVDWFQAHDYCAAQKPAKRLPTEAEWEKAAKGGSDAPPEPLGDYAWFAKNSGYRAHPVMQKKPNGYGVYDMLGNVREWCADWWDKDYYAQRVADDPTGPATGTRRIERGGAFFLPARGVTTTLRYHHQPEIRLYFLGFRCAADAES